MSLVKYVPHYCKITNGHCKPRSCKECPKSIGSLFLWCVNFVRIEEGQDNG